MTKKTNDMSDKIGKVKVISDFLPRQRDLVKKNIATLQEKEKMKLDYDLIRKILENIETQSDGQNTVQVTANEIQGDCSQEQIDYHLQILGDDALIDIETRLDGVVGTTMINRLTAEGHRVLEAMKNDTIWNKIKDGLSNMGRDGVKQIPSLAIKLLLAANTAS